MSMIYGLILGFMLQFFKLFEGWMMNDDRWI